MNIELKIFGLKQTVQSLNQDINNIHNLSVSDVKRLGTDCANYMADYIDTHRRRPKRRHSDGTESLAKLLRKQVEVEQLKTVTNVLIGDVVELNAKAPHWKALQFGQDAGFKPPRNYGVFDDGVGRPRGGRGRGDWKHHYAIKGQWYLLKPQKFTSIRYIDAGLQWLYANANAYFR